MRKLAVIVAVIAASPIVAGQGAALSPAAGTPARPAPHQIARVNGVTLMSDRLDMALRALIPFESFHRSVSAEKMTALRVKALQTVIEEELEYQDGVRLGIQVGDADVDAAVAKARKNYRTTEAFHAALRQSGGSMAALRREVRRSLTIRRAQDRAVTAKCQVDAVEAKRFFAANLDRFVVPEQLHVFAITIGVEPSASPKEWTDARACAEDVRRQLSEGASFEELARTYSTDASKTAGGDMGLVHRGSLNDEFEQALRDQKAGHVSGVVKTLYGYHIVRIGEIRAPRQKTFADVGAEIRRDLTATRCAEMKDAWIARLRAGASIAS